MMQCIVLDDDDDCVMVTEPTSNPKKPESNLSFHKKLIAYVRKHRMLYDNKHKLFTNVAKKEMVWQLIAKKLNVDVNICKNTWIELRYSYQCHARRLRKHFLSGENKNRKRSSMQLETELMFLWRLVENRKSRSLPFEIEDPSCCENNVNATMDNIQFGTEDLANQVIDDDLILVEEPVECIVIEEDEDIGKTDKQFKITSGMKSLIEQIKKHPELFDTKHVFFNDYTRKSYIWNAIASILGDKATKLMKCWIIMQTRYEWELNQAPSTNKDNPRPMSNLECLLEFLKNHILKNPDTVYKQSYYLKIAWQEPIDYFKEIYNLIVRMKKSADLVYITDALLRTPEKSTQYQTLWTEIATVKDSTPGQCETTWLIMRHFYWELMYMRQQSYQLTDKWYFETVITELYEISKTSQLAKQNAHQIKEKPNKTYKQPKPKVKTPKPVSIRPKSTPQMPIKIINNLPAHTMVQQQQQAPLPKITGAVSLAPQAFTGGPLQIRPLAVTPNVPVQSQLLNGSTTSAPPHTNMHISYNLPPQQNNNSSTLTFPTVSTGQSLLPPLPTMVQAAPPMIRNTTPTFVKNLAPPSTRCLAPPPVQIPTGLRPTMLNSNISNSNIGPPATTSSVLYSHPPLNPVVNVTATSNNVVTTHTNVPMVSAQMPITPLPMSTVNTVNTGSAATTNPQEQFAVAAAPANNINVMPKITGAVSLLNHNEILIELIASQNGNNLVVHGPPLSEKYQLSMETVAKFIRQILAIPLLHNKCHNQPTLINSYWEHISSRFNLPPHICRACWNFLLHNFTHFPQIAPLKELMAPFKTSLVVWKTSDSLFKVFDDHCVSMGWLKHMACLPEVVECISSYPVLYKDVTKASLIETQSDMEALCAWRTLRLRFPKIDDIQDLWTAVKNCFCQYMSDLEYGIDNKWPINWWRALARLKFLVEARYATNEPFYYIVSNKMLEEIERCALLEMKSRYNNNEIETSNNGENLEDFEMQIPVVQVPNLGTTSVPLSPPDIESIDVNCVEQVSVETVALLTAIQKHPEIYGKANSVEKFEAWEKVAKELNMDTTDCILSFKHATQKYCAYKKQNSLSRCRLNEKYYRKMEEIFRGHLSIKKTGACKLNIKTPFQLNQSLEMDDSNSSSELIFPERYISDINMSNCHSNLVVKNWSFALGNLQLDDNFNLKLRNILNKYLTNK